MQALQDRFGAKAALQIALRADDSDPRSAERWLAGNGMSADNLAALIGSDVGGVVLDALMGADQAAWPDWYRAFRRQTKLSSLRRGLKVQQKLLDEIEAEG